MIKISLDTDKRNSELRKTGREIKYLLGRPERERSRYTVLKYFKTVRSSQAMNRWTIYGEMGKDSINLVNASCFAVAAYIRWFSLQHNNMHMNSYHRVPATGDEPAFALTLP